MQNEECTSEEAAVRGAIRPVAVPELVDLHISHQFGMSHGANRMKRRRPGTKISFPRLDIDRFPAEEDVEEIARRGQDCFRNCVYINSSSSALAFYILEPLDYTILMHVKRLIAFELSGVRQKAQSTLLGQPCFYNLQTFGFSICKLRICVY